LPKAKVILKTPIQNSRSLLAQVQQILSRKPKGIPQELLQEAVDLLRSGRRYGSVAIYLVSGDEAVRQAYAGAEPVEKLAAGEGLVGEAVSRGMVSSESDERFELAVPARIASRVAAVIYIRHTRSLSYQDEVLLKQVARALVKFTVSSNGRLLQRKLRSARQVAKPLVAEGKLTPAADHSVALPRRRAAGVATVS
jgi:putative methionine-R-sulfoxide reductase with GAF domain